MSFPRGLLAAFVILVLLPAATLIALGVQLLRHDRDLERRRRLENSAAALQRFQSDALRTPTLGPLLYLPNPPTLPEPPPDPEADRLEFQSSDPAPALAYNTRRAGHPNPAIQAGALLRIARIHRNRNNLPLALDAWSRLAQFSNVAIDAEPAPLFARRAICRALAATRSPDLPRYARQLLDDLHNGRFPISRDTYLLAAEQAAEWLGRPVPTPPEALARAETLSNLWPRRHTPAGALCQDRLALFWSNAATALVPLPPSAACGPDNVPIPVPDPAPLPEFTARRRALLAALAATIVLISAAAWFALRALNRELSAARLQSDFVSAVSHEFRTPLTSLRQFNEMLLDSPDLHSATRVHYYQAQSRATARLSRLVETLLDFGRMEAGRQPYQLAPLDAAELLRHLIAEFQSAPASAAVRIHCDIPASPLPVRADREALSRALWNLLDNAVKYSPEKPDITLSARDGGPEIHIAVADRGLGIPAHDLPHLFQKFVRAGNAVHSGIPGTGLGLAMVRHIARAHGGRIAVHSVENQGSTFTLTLPHA